MQINIILSPIIGARYICYVRVPFFIADEMDLAKTITGMFASSASKRPCNICDSVFSISMMGRGATRDVNAIREVNNHLLQSLAHTQLCCSDWTLET